MSLVDKVNALWRSLFGADAQPALAEAVGKLRQAMGMPTTGSLPGDVDELMKATGVAVAAAPPVAPVGPAPAPDAAEPAPSDGARKRKARPPPKKQPTLLQALPHAVRTTISSDELKKQRMQAVDGIDYSPRQEDRRTFDSEKESAKAEAAARAAPVKEYPCPQCPRKFTNAGGLASHRRTHTAGVQPKIFEQKPMDTYITFN